jgi:hypothetical protein
MKAEVNDSGFSRTLLQISCCTKFAQLVYDKNVGADAPLGRRMVFMEVSSASSSLYTTINSQPTQARNRQLEQEQSSQQAAQARASAPQPQQASEAPPQPPVNETGQSVSAQAEAERNRPVVNTSGQLVGTRVNTTA